MSGYIQKPPPVLQQAWWYPPDKFMAHLCLRASMAASIEPWVASCIGSKTFHLSKNSGKKNRGTSKHLHM